MTRGLSWLLLSGLRLLLAPATSLPSRLNGTAEADGSVELGAAVVKGYEEFDKSVLPLIKGDTIGMEIAQDSADATAPGNIEVIVYVQVGRSET